MKILLINSVCGIRSTGRICIDIAKEYIERGHECIVAYGREYVPKEYKDISYRIGSDMNVRLNGLKARVLDNEGFNAIYQTKKFIKWANNYNPDLLWLHNLHGYYINVELLFEWIKSRPQMEVRWTLHDCWPFTGHCPHFTFAECNQWKDICVKCVQSKKYPVSFLVDNCKRNFKKKKKAFCGVKKLTIQTPSEWMNKLVMQSFLKDYPVEVVHNTIDTTIFNPTESDFRERYGLQDKKIVLGVASAWGRRKGLYDFFEISKKLDNTYQVVLVGLTGKQIQQVPKNIICIERTDSMKELAGIYSNADVFVNPSREESFGLTTLEAVSCGTTAIVFKDTACEEVVKHYGGIAVEQNMEALYNAIVSVVDNEAIEKNVQE